MTKVRDQQRSRVYAAEEALRDMRHGVGDRQADRLDSMDELTAWVRKIEASSWYRKTFPAASRAMRVGDGRAQRRPLGGWLGIDMPRWSRSKLIVLHEVAHHVTIRHYGAGWRNLIATHGWEFCDAYLKLVRHFMGADDHARLKASFKAHRVRFTAPRKRATRSMTEEQRSAAVERLAAARANRPGPVHGPDRPVFTGWHYFYGRDVRLYHQKKDRRWFVTENDGPCLFFAPTKAEVLAWARGYLGQQERSA